MPRQRLKSATGRQELGKFNWVLLWALAARATGAEGHLALTVQVINNVNAPEAEVREAKAEAGWMFKKAGIDIDWVECSPPTQGILEPACGAIDHPMIFVLSIKAGEPPNGSATAMGFALMQGYSNHGAALYPRIKDVVKSNPEYENSSILGSVLAHELAHLVFRTTEHGDGVMRAKWERGDYRAMAQRKLGFNRGQAEKLRAMLAVRMASAGTGTALLTMTGRRR